MKEIDIFRVEEKFLNGLFSQKGIHYSKNKILSTIRVTPELLLEKGFTLEYCDVTTHSEGISYLEGIFSNKSNFYIYLSKRSFTDISYEIKIYFEPKDLVEVNFFIKKLLKLKEDNGN